MEDIQETGSECVGIKFFIQNEGGSEIARAYLYIMHNDLHLQPFGFMEDVFVDDSLRGQGHGTSLVNKIIQKAKESGCYKLVATSRDSRQKVHKMYEKMGFSNYGREFRINF